MTSQSFDSSSPLYEWERLQRERRKQGHMSDKEILDWLEAELQRGKTVSAMVSYDPNKACYRDHINFFSVHSQHLETKTIREAVEKAASMSRIL
jgi:hypothetical protein